MSVDKRNVLSMKQRMDVLKDLETASINQVAVAHNISRRTVFRIKKEVANIAQIVESANSSQKAIKKQYKPKLYLGLEKQLYSWFVERRTLGDMLSDALLLEKARELSASNVSYGWLQKFKRRKNIRLVHLYGEKASADETAAQNFISILKKQIEEEDIDLKCIYNMDETGLQWKALQSKTLAGKEELNLSGSKEKKERVTVALCANATGTHKLKPFFIHKYKKPKALKNGTDQLPVIYTTSQKNAWMDQKLFMEWFIYFTESVKLFQLREGICSKVILLLDNCGAHKLPINYTCTTNVEIKYLPPNTTSLIQPMDQGVIAKTKTRFRYKLMRRAITHAGGTTEFYKKYTIKDCIIQLANAWADVTSVDITHCWHKLLPYTRIRGEAGIVEGEAEEENKDVQNSVTCQDECRDEGVAVTQRTSRFPLNAEDRQKIESHLAGLEEYNEARLLDLMLKTVREFLLGPTS